ncbi:PREDICTED: uncharacterized protein LOC109151377 [Ipomoea nil]|uniref:uncharacterized protein LOC109151377 n=1 Tax=Ipomoea nil TaxID=35883 RepID=UPI0009016544|nr:PREDICTED: uncharacterized protein LOC109151377 [Ipomoea nil]
MEVRVKKGFSEKQKSKIDVKRNSTRLLITVNVPGSAGPLRFVVNEDDKVAGVIDMALKQYAHQGRLPLLGSDPTHFLLLPTSLGLEALGASELIGLCGVRNFILCKKQPAELRESRWKAEGMIDQKSKSSSCWKTWLNKSFAFKIHFH